MQQSRTTAKCRGLSIVSITVVVSYILPIEIDCLFRSSTQNSLFLKSFPPYTASILLHVQTSQVHVLTIFSAFFRSSVFCFSFLIDLVHNIKLAARENMPDICMSYRIVTMGDLLSLSGIADCYRLAVSLIWARKLPLSGSSDWVYFFCWAKTISDSAQRKLKWIPLTALSDFLITSVLHQLPIEMHCGG